VTYSIGASGGISFVSTSVTQQTITTAGKSQLNLTFNGVGGNWQLVDALTSIGTITLTAGTLDTNNQTVMVAAFSSTNSNVRTLTLGSSAITLSLAGTAWNAATVTNLTVTANTAVVTLTGNTGSFTSGTVNWNGLSVVLSGAGVRSLGGSNNYTLNNVTRTGTATVSDTFSIATAGVICTGTFTVTGNSAVNRMLVYSNALGTARTITAGAVSLTNVDFRDITAAGAAAPFTGTSIGNALGNNNITFTTPVTRYGVVAGNWSSTAVWSTSSGGAGGASVPLCHDTVILDANSAAGSYSMDMPRSCADLTCTGFTRTLVHTGFNPEVYGSVTLASGMTFTGNIGITLRGRTSLSLTSAGKTWGGNLGVSGPNGTYTLVDALTMSAGSVTINSLCSFNDAGFSVSADRFSLDPTTLTMTGTWTQNNFHASPWTWSGNGTLTATASTIVIGAANSGTRTFAGGSKTYGTLTYTVANSPGSLTITGANTFNTLNVGSGRILTMPASTSNTVTNFNVNGVNNGYLYSPAASSGGASVPTNAGNDITGDIDIRVAHNMVASVGSGNTIISKADNALYTVELEISSIGIPILRWRTSADVSRVAACTTTIPSWAVGNLYLVRATLDVDNGASQYDVKFYTKATVAGTAHADTLDDTGWSQLGSTVTGSTGTTNIKSTTENWEVGGGFRSPATQNLFNGYLYATVVKSGIAGTVAIDIDWTTKPVGVNSFTESSSNAATVTINGTLAQAGDGRVSLVSSTPSTAATLSKSSGDVNCDYLSIQDSAATGGARYFAGTNSVNVSGNTGWNFQAPTYNTSSTGIIG